MHVWGLSHEAWGTYRWATLLKKKNPLLLVVNYCQQLLRWEGKTQTLTLATLEFLNNLTLCLSCGGDNSSCELVWSRTVWCPEGIIL